MHRHRQRRRHGQLRWPLLAGAAALGAAATAIWFAWLPGYRPALRPGESYGIDVSSYQGNIDWGLVARDDVRFAYIKATEGATLVDPDFARNWAAAARAGLARGAYHYFSLCDPGLVQARNFLRTVPRARTALAPAVDLELAGNCSARPSRAVVGAQLSAFLEAVQAATGTSPVLYLGNDFAQRYPLALEHTHVLWLRRALHRPSTPDWTLWQVDGNAHIDGVQGDVDLDVMRSTGTHGLHRRRSSSDEIVKQKLN
jgi:lysozyme